MSGGRAGRGRNNNQPAATEVPSAVASPLAMPLATPIQLRKSDYYIDKGWYNIHFPVSNQMKAWNCALDIEGWLNVFTAGRGGQVTHVSGIPGKVGLTYINSSTIVVGVNATFLFEKYTLTAVTEGAVGKRLKFEVNTDGLQSRSGSKSLLLDIVPEKGNDRQYFVKISLSNQGKTSLMIKETQENTFWRAEDRRWKFLGQMLQSYFENYVPKPSGQTPGITTVADFPEAVRVE